MFSSGKKNETVINVMLDEPLTSDSCTKIVIELVKYILYQRQQIPFAYEALAQFQTSVKATDKNAVSFRTLSSILQNVSDNLSSQFFLDDCDIKEVAILLGATIFSPKLCIGIELPSYILSSRQHKEYQHLSRKPLLQLMRSMLECDAFQEAMSAPSSLTNMFIMLRKNDCNSVSEFFLPKPQYALPTQTASCFKIKLCHSDQANVRCNCRTLVEVYHEMYKTRVADKHDIQYIEHNNFVPSSYGWFQSQQIIKGFKFYS